jgi:hypothetical protein
LARIEVERLLEYRPESGPIGSKQLSQEARFRRLESLLGAFYPSFRSVEMQDLIDANLRRSYERRNLLEPRFFSNISKAIERVRRTEYRRGGDAHAAGILFVGDSGIGKSRTLERIAALFPCVITHSVCSGVRIPFRQVPILKVDCPGSCSIQDLCTDILKQYDTLLGTPYVSVYVRRNLKGADDLKANVLSIALLNGTGLIVIDEGQCIDGMRGKELLRYVGDFRRVGIAVILVGTADLQRRLKRLQPQGFGSITATVCWSRYDHDDPDWQNIVAAVWNLQYASTPNPLTLEVAEAVFAWTQGIPDSLVKLHKRVQEQLIFSAGVREVTPALIDHIADGLFSFQKLHLRRMSEEEAVLPIVGE